MIAPAPRAPRDYTPKYLADKILQSKSALEGERKQVTVEQGSINHLFGGSQRTVFLDLRRHLPSTGRAGSPTGMWTGATSPNSPR